MERPWHSEGASEEENRRARRAFQVKRRGMKGEEGEPSPGSAYHHLLDRSRRRLGFQELHTPGHEREHQGNTSISLTCRCPRTSCTTPSLSLSITSWPISTTASHSTAELWPSRFGGASPGYTCLQLGGRGGRGGGVGEEEGGGRGGGDDPPQHLEPQSPWSHRSPSGLILLRVQATSVSTLKEIAWLTSV